MILFASAILLALISLLTFYRSQMLLTALLIFASALCLRLYFNAQDAYLHDWDERYHALVAKNMMEHPFTPMLRSEPVLPYDYHDWCCNHIWLHKQPLFLWQMALSMKLFGVNEFALRLPSAILCALLAMIIFRMGIIIKKPVAGLAAALLFTFSFFSIEQCCGAIGMDHNDIAMGFYVVSSLWALLEYYHSGKKWWIIFIGLFAGMAILVKWLTGLLVYACWGLCIAFTEKRIHWKKELPGYGFAILITALVAIPWQHYILKQFPREAKAEFAFNGQHITEAVEHHSGSPFYYLNELSKHYSSICIPFILCGLFLLLRQVRSSKTRIIITSSIALVYIFFSVIVASKLSGYVYIVAPCVLLLMGLCYQFAWDMFQKKFDRTYSFLLIAILIGITCSFLLQYRRLNNSHEHGRSNYNYESKENKIHNTAVYKQLDSILQGNYLVFNCNKFEDVEAMFYSHQNVYAWYPEEKIYDSLKTEGYKIAAFTDHGKSTLPDYIKNDTAIVIIEPPLR